MKETHDKHTETHACDYISRQAALDEKNIVHMEMFGRDFPVVPVETLKGLPPVDAVPVVRCKDCKWCNMGECEHKLGLIWANDENYCSLGERKDGDGNG